ncbi:MFS transporter [Virgisporangium aliadipatigenens]|uniref:MFS transporter n=1 Tax=Virgisporangium aliadipatigenens TaxID=741659 RepID=A0A8J3YPY2_9ACTN|nr:MFS transporter [Virgisporangium aliadipatigenens]GIJ47751.1 MFS transporter [Virgisporangium aliadipatigenens]
MNVPENTGHPRRWAILGVLVVSLLVVVLDNTVLNTALRVIADKEQGLGATQGELEWAINSYTLVFAGLLFTAGVVGDRIGRRLMLTVGLVVFGAASLASAYAQSPEQLIAARAFMGLGAAGIMPATLSIISNVFDPRERARAIGAWAGAVGLGAAIGPLVGGGLLEKFWWGSVFLINVPIVIGGVVAVTVLVPESKDPKPGRIDVGGVLLSIVGLTALVYGIIHGGEHGFDRPQAWVSIVAGVAVLATFVWIESRSTHPSLDVRLFRNPAFSAASAAVGLAFFAVLGSFFFIVFYLQLVRGLSPLETGWLMVPFAVAQLIFAPRSAAMVRRFGPKFVASGGLALTTLALVGFTLIRADTPVWTVGALFFLMGVGMANVMPPATESIMSTLPREKAGVGSAVSNTVRQVGGALGVAVLGSLLSAAYRNAMDDQVAGLPAPLAKAAKESLAGTYGVADGLGERGAALIAPANAAFIDAMHMVALASVFVGAISVAVVLAWMPRRSTTAPTPTQKRETPQEPALAEATV